jgi:pyruvate ferredoxin oxidoreductase delta subunit
MYYVAKVDAEKCATYKCNTCTLYCPEANTLMFDKKEGKGVAWVDGDRCKGCALCVYVCTDMLKRECISMEMISTED